MSGNEQNFSGALSTWRDINLIELQKTLDTQSIELVDSQKESVIGRKGLADKTKDFKKLPDSEKTNAFKGLLKAYQTEIDNLTKRCKASENAFLNVYKLLAEAPDPYPLLEAAVDQTVKVAEAEESQADLRRLRQENADLKRRLSEMSNLESSKKKAEARTEQLEKKMEDMIQEKVAQKENELNATYHEKLRNYEEREQGLQRQINLTKEQLRDLRLSNDSNEAKLLTQFQKQDQEVFAKLAEMDIIVADLERANSRVASVEHRNEILRAEIETLRSGLDSSDRVKGLELQISELENETQRLSTALDAQQSKLQEAEAAKAKHSEDTFKEMQRKTSEIEQLKSKLRTYSDYDEIKRELDIMKYVEFAGLDDAEEELGQSGDVQLPNPNASKANGQVGTSLEALLATKNKKILEELTKFRVLHQELEHSLQAAQDEISSLSTDLQEQRSLNEKLENDLLSMNSHKSEAKSLDSSDVLANLDLGSRANGSSVKTNGIPFAPSADTSILPIVTSQRDRFRQRNSELEDELRKQFQTISGLRAEVKSLQSDNLKLYEKVRYMQSYREEAGARPPVSQLDPLPAPNSGRPDEMNRYQARYEEAMNPFEAFRGREATRAYSNLNPIERAVLTITRSILSSRRSRTFFMFYTIALHVFVMYTTYECGSTDSTRVARPPGGF